MKITEMGVVQATLQELDALQLEHLWSVLDTEPWAGSPTQRCGRPTRVWGYTEWRAHADLPISMGWDWQIQTHNKKVCWLRDEWPRTNIQLLDGQGQVLNWQDNLQTLAVWIDRLGWQRQVKKALCQ